MTARQTVAFGSKAPLEMTRTQEELISIYVECDMRKLSVVVEDLFLLFKLL